MIFSSQISVYNLSPFGMQMNGRFETFATKGYRFAFQGQEMDDEVKGKGVSANYKYRLNDTRIGRFLAVDPLEEDYPWNSPYAFSENMVIHAVELEGLEADVLYTTDIDKIMNAASDDINNYPNVLTIVSHAGPHGARITEDNKKGGLIDGPKSLGLC